MNQGKIAKTVALAAGLALSAAAQAQFAFVTNQPGAFVDIGATGTLLGGGDDASFGFTVPASCANAAFPAGLINVCTNGHTGYGPSDTQYSNGTLPATFAYTGNVACVAWDDWITNTTHGGDVYAQVIGNTLIIEWKNMDHYGSSPSAATFELQIFGGGSGPGGAMAQYVYQNMDTGDSNANGASATIGYQYTPTSAVQYAFNVANSVHSGTVLSLMLTGTLGACCLSDGSCILNTSANCSAQNGIYRGDNTVCASANCPQPPTGACCVVSGCTVLTQAQCAAQTGVYAGDNVTCAAANCPPPGACCLPNLTCVMTNSSGCTAQGGVFRGPGVNCAAAACPGPTLGPDVYVGDLTDVQNFGAVGNITAYAVGTNACNAGDAPVSWVANNNTHPVIAQDMYRLMNGRFEQIGQSWLKHGFSSTNSNFCGTCQQPPNGGAQLGVHCSDAYGAGLNGSQNNLGPRSLVNATTGAYPYPFSAPGFSTIIDRRLQVLTTDVTPANNPGALYYVQGHYVTADDATWNNGLNNATYKQISVTSPTTNPPFIGAAHVQQPGIQAWKDQDPTVTLVNADYTESALTARFIVGAKATNNGNGTWHYEYAVYNHNANRSGGSFSVPVGLGVSITNIGFHAPFSHSGEPYDNSPWTAQIAGGAITFTPVPVTPSANTNAIRWSTLYNFRFDANIAPATGNATIGLFLSGTPSSVVAAGVPVPGTAVCYANCDGSTVQPILNVNDFTCFLNRFAAGDSYANCDGSTTQPILNVNDFTCFMNAYAAGCP